MYVILYKGTIKTERYPDGDAPRLYSSIDDAKRAISRDLRYMNGRIVGHATKQKQRVKSLPDDKPRDRRDYKIRKVEIVFV